MALSVEYKKAEAGWIEITLHGDNGSFDIAISEVFDPFEDWFYAIERIYRSDPPSIIINPEGRTYRIDFTSLHIEYRVCVSEHDSNKELFVTIATREEMVEQFYGKLMEFVRSDRYDSKEYESTSEKYRFCGFPLKNYRNEILEEHLENKVFVNDNTVYSKCRCCEQIVRVKTIDDMLERAYKIIDSDPKLTQLLCDLRLNKYSVGISQEFSRFKKLSEPFKKYFPDYRCIQGSESGIYLGFREDFSKLETIEILPNLFDNNHIRGWKSQFNSFIGDDKVGLLENAFTKFNPQLQNLNSYVEIKDFSYMGRAEIALKMPNKRMEENMSFACFPNIDIRVYPYFKFDINHDKKDGRLNKICLNLCDSQEVDVPVSKWLHQKVVYMYPDYGDVYLWFDGAAGGLESLDGYNFEDGDLNKKFDDWHRIFDDSWSKTDIDWATFNQVGKELHKELQEIVKSDYILVYLKSYEETCGTHEEHEMMENTK